MGNQSGTTFGWSVEARSTYLEPQRANGQTFDQRWKMVRFDPAECGVPIAGPWEERLFSMVGLLGYAAAQALRWWFHANVTMGFCLETRLVKHKVEWTIKEERISEHCLIGGDDRSSMMPDYPPSTT